jgi:hypothetical protein
MIKTVLPTAINTIDEAKKFFAELYANNEAFHPDDDANDIIDGRTSSYDRIHGYTGKNLFTAEEATQVNKLMEDIFNLENFDPYQCLMLLDTDNILRWIEEGEQFKIWETGEEVTVTKRNNEYVHLSTKNRNWIETESDVIAKFQNQTYDL